MTNKFPLHVVTAWLGNTPQVASKHYLQVTDEHFAQATAGVLQKAVQKLQASGGNGSQSLSENPEKSRGSAVFPTFTGSVEYTPEDSNL